MEPLHSDDLTIEVTHPEAGLCRVVWRGSSSSREPGKVLRPYLEPLIARVAEKKGRIEMEFQHLEHLNSSTIAEVIQLIHRSIAAKVSLTLIYDAGVRWQILSFEGLERAMKMFATNDAAVRIVGIRAGATA